MGDRSILWDVLQHTSVSREEFLKKLPDVADKFREFLSELSQSGAVYEAIADARNLVDQVTKASHLTSAVLTGNLGPSADWKLSHTNYEKFYTFGVFGHEADVRNDLASLALTKARSYVGKINARDVVVIGDTVHDIRCAKFIGATTIIVTTGWNIDKAPLVAENPDLLVDSLLDPKVLKLLEI